jgi:hypothetical protein
MYLIITATCTGEARPVLPWRRRRAAYQESSVSVQVRQAVVLQAACGGTSLRSITTLLSNMATLLNIPSNNPRLEFPGRHLGSFRLSNQPVERTIPFLLIADLVISLVADVGVLARVDMVTAITKTTTTAGRSTIVRSRHFGMITRSIVHRQHLVMTQQPLRQKLVQKPSVCS